MWKPRQTFATVAVLAVVCIIGSAMRRPAPVDPAHHAVATVAGGCFWGLQESLRKIPGVIKTTVGYTGGTTANPTYQTVATHQTGHMEAVEVVFDPARLSYEALLTEFLTKRNPINQSGTNQVPRRSTVFYHDAGQRLTAERVTSALNCSGKWSSPLVVNLAPDTKFYRAEEFHQDYYQKVAAGQSCTFD